jgi:hypothetical protein
MPLGGTVHGTHLAADRIEIFRDTALEPGGDMSLKPVGGSIPAMRAANLCHHQ